MGSVHTCPRCGEGPVYGEPNGTGLCHTCTVELAKARYDRAHVDNRPPASNLAPMTGSMSMAVHRNPQGSTQRVDNPPCATCNDTGIAGVIDGKPYPCRMCGAHERNG